MQKASEDSVPDAMRRCTFCIGRKISRGASGRPVGARRQQETTCVVRTALHCQPLSMTFLYAEPLPDRRGERGLVQRVEVQPRGAPRERVLAQLAHDVEAERADRTRVVTVAFEPAADPSRDLGAAGIGKRASLVKLPIGMMPGTIGMATPSAATASTKCR